MGRWSALLRSTFRETERSNELCFGDPQDLGGLGEVDRRRSFALLTSLSGSAWTRAFSWAVGGDTKRLDQCLLGDSEGGCRSGEIGRSLPRISEGVLQGILRDPQALSCCREVEGLAVRTSLPTRPSWPHLRQAEGRDQRFLGNTEDLRRSRDVEARRLLVLSRTAPARLSCQPKGDRSNEQHHQSECPLYSPVHGSSF
jgi:hypothetical protein